MDSYFTFGTLALGTVLVAKHFFGRRQSIQNPPSLKGRSNLGVVVTGGSRGVGFALARRFLQLGHRVVICGRNPTSLQAAQEELDAKFPNRVFSIACDITDYAQLVELGKFATKSLQCIDVWINNAGISQSKANVSEMKSEEIKRIIDCNLLGAAYGVKVAVEVMNQQESGGHVFLMEGAGSDGRVMPKHSMYCTSKFGVWTCTSSMYVCTCLYSRLHFIYVCCNSLYIVHIYM